MLSQLIFAVVACAALIAPSVAGRRAHENYHTILQDRYRLGLSVKPQDSRNVTTHTLEQPLDHFDRYNTDKYNQTYYINEQFLDVGRPVGFIFLGGEWEEESSTIEYGTNIMSSWAQTFSGIMINVQHRYYDNFNPPHKTTNFLNSMQALADAARVVKQVNADYSSKLKQPIKWIVTSGSYGGIMAATFRLRYPELTVGAVAFSAPVTATLAFNGFNEVLGRALNESDPACLITVREALKELDGYLDDSSKGWAKVNADFKTNIKSELDAETWATDLSRQISWEVCESAGTTPYEQLTNTEGLASIVATYSPAAIINPYGELWGEQLCSEWSFFQTGTDFDTNPLQIAPRHVSPNVFMAACSIYGFTPAQVEENIRWTNVQYGGKNFTTTNTVFSNGDADAWSPAGIIEHIPNVSGNHIYIIEGGIHCSDMYWPTNQDSKSLMAARAAEVDAIKQWLSA